jgi:hypothetical protein
MGLSLWCLLAPAAPCTQPYAWFYPIRLSEAGPAASQARNARGPLLAEGEYVDASVTAIQVEALL